MCMNFFCFREKKNNKIFFLEQNNFIGQEKNFLLKLKTWGYNKLY